MEGCQVMRKQRVRRFKIVSGKTSRRLCRYPLGLKGVVVGEGDTFEEALEDAPLRWSEQTQMVQEHH